ncbi:Glutathione transport system permease gsiD [Melia azedarach]|uniref:Glutathione transport system permease gsiD n=1 Tax=Melia azedarach TaxID=155640 RepID=A0ACC1YPI4_MELAZ|nr:Glutathione transport system permease gsiD [Melia azedarach]
MSICISTSCINGYSYVLIASNSQLKRNHRLKHSNLLYLRSSETTRRVLHDERGAPLRANAIADSLILGANTAPAKSGDITVFLQTSAVLFFVYWIANFVVPDLISKYFEFDKINEDQNQKRKPNDKR